MAEAQNFSKQLLDWFQHAGRKHLPWQRKATLYRVWVSEIMLQQTQVATVIPYFQRFMQRFPDVRALAAASSDEVLHHWSGLGYYARARNLQQAAQLICRHHQGRVPEDYEALLALPGIGRSTAGAILSLALGQPHAILDGNVKRVLTRCFAIDGWPGQSQVQRRLWRLAGQLTPRDRAKEYNQAIMDLGATVCTRRRPDCVNCPLQTLCQGRSRGDPEAYPTAKPRKPLPSKQVHMLLVHNGRELLLERRPPNGIWGGLWGLPECLSQREVVGRLEQLGVVGELVATWPERRHTFTHFHLQITPLEIRAKNTAACVLDGDGRVWYNTGQPDTRGLAAPVARLIDELKQRLEGEAG